MTTIGCKSRDGYYTQCKVCDYRDDLLLCFLYRNKEQRTVIQK